MESLRERGESLFMRTEFAHQFCAFSDLPIVLMAFFDPQARTFSESWIGRREVHSDEDGRTILRAAEIRLATWAATRPSQTDLSDQTLGSTIWMDLGDFSLGIGSPVSGLWPILACSRPAEKDLPQHMILMQMGLAYVSQQLAQGFYDRTAWMSTLVESALQILSIHFLVVTQDGHVKFDSLHEQQPHEGSSDWVMRDKIISHISDGGRSEFMDAISAAISPAGQSSIASVFLSPDIARLVAISPLETDGTNMALILFESEHTDHFKLREHFFSVYNLTPSESLISHDILSGRSIAEAAEANNLTQATVRSYMKQVFAKTGTHRQSDLVSLYFHSILPVSGNLQAISRQAKH